MVVTYYADVIFAWNFLMDFFLLFLIHPDMKKRYWRLAVAAAIGGGAALLMLCLSVHALLLYFVLRFFWAAVMVVIAIPARGVGEFLCNTALLYGASGSLYGISELVSDRVGYWKEKEFLLMIFAFAVVFTGKALYRFRRKQCQRLVYQFIVGVKNGQKQTECKAFFDSGNHLFEPISGKPVILVRNRVAVKLHVNPEKLRAVPYSSLGKRSGMLEAYPIEELIVRDGRNTRQFSNIYVAVAEDTMFAQEDCDVILHADMILCADIGGRSNHNFRMK